MESLNCNFIVRVLKRDTGKNGLINDFQILKMLNARADVTVTGMLSTS